METDPALTTRERAKDPPLEFDARWAARLHELFGDRYRVERTVGVSPLGTILRGTDVESNQPVVIRILKTPADEAPSLAEQLDRQQRAIDALHLDGAVAAQGVAPRGDAVVLVSRALGGGNLDDVLRARTVVPAERITAWIDRLASILDAAHAAGVMHGGVKPTNIIFDDHARPCLVDWGVSSALFATRDASGAIASRAQAYAAPEQWRRQRVGERADQYSLALVAHELLTGQRRLDAPQIEGIQTVTPVEISPDAPLRPGLPLHVNLSLRRALSGNPTGRYATTRAFADAFAGRHHPVTAKRRASTWPGWVEGVTAAAICAILGTAIGLTLSSTDVRVDLYRRMSALGARFHLNVKLPRVRWMPSALGSAGTPGGGTTSGSSGSVGLTSGAPIGAPVGTRPPTNAVPVSIGQPVGGTGGASAARDAIVGTPVGSGTVGSSTIGSAAYGVVSRTGGDAAARSEQVKAVADSVGWIRVASGGANALVVLDGLPRGTTPGTVRVATGAHAISVQALGVSFDPPVRTVFVPRGETVAVTFARARRPSP